MCDYSLHPVASRPAKIEDKLVTTTFNNSITRGFSAIGKPNVAVCVLPGTEIAFDDNVEREPLFGIGLLPNKKIGQRDALEFPDGQPADFAINATKYVAPSNQTSETVPNRPTKSDASNNPTVNVTLPPNLSAE